MPAMERSAHALTRGFRSDKSFWKQLIDNKASFERLTIRVGEEEEEGYKSLIELMNIPNIEKQE